MRPSHPECVHLKLRQRARMIRSDRFCLVPAACPPRSADRPFSLILFLPSPTRSGLRFSERIQPDRRHACARDSCRGRAQGACRNRRACRLLVIPRMVRSPSGPQRAASLGLAAMPAHRPIAGRVLCAVAEVVPVPAPAPPTPPSRSCRSGEKAPPRRCRSRRRRRRLPARSQAPPAAARTGRRRRRTPRPAASASS